MVRKIDLLLLTLAACAGVALFHTSYQVQGLREEKAALERKIVQENDGIQVLRAEWSFLNDPSRLEQLAAAHLTLKPITATQIASFEAIPMRPPGATIPVAAQPPAALAARKEAAVRTAAASHPVAAGAGRAAPLAGATLASMQVPAQPRRAAKQGHPAPTPGGTVTRVSTHPVLPAKDDIGALLTRLGRIQ